ncbi:MAG: cell division protein SepF [Acidimicrobiales bacterium]
MASFARRAMVYLGLTDDDYDDYDKYEEPVAPVAGRAPVRPYPQAPETPEQFGAIRTLPREEPSGIGMVTTRPSGVVRALPTEKPKVHVVAPDKFADAQQIGDRLRTSQPVIVNLQVVDRDLSRRMIDFCSGVTYALGGNMEKVADQVFLLTPSNVEVSAEERQRLSERGLYRSR